MVMIFQLFSDPVQAVAFVLAILMALAVHEAAHALVANFLGDETAKLAGRLTLNPLAHLDPFGVVMFLLIGFGWGKPVPVNPNNFRNPALDDFKVAVAGPLSNLALAIVFGIPLRLLNDELAPWAVGILALLVFINLALMIFNLIPIPPLDGSKVIGVFFGQEVLYRLERISWILLIGLLLLVQANFPIVSDILLGGTHYLFRLITGLSPGF